MTLSPTDQLDQPSTPSPETAQISSENITAQPTDTPEQKKIRSTLKRLMVPELSPPHHEQLIAENYVPEPSSGKVMQKQLQQENMPDVQTGHKQSKTWLWIALSLFLFAIATLAVLYFLVPKSS